MKEIHELSDKVKAKFKLRTTKPNKKWMKDFVITPAQTEEDRFEQEKRAFNSIKAEKRRRRCGKI